jgi:hypothetical protein
MDDIFIAANIICSIVDTHDVMFVHPVMLKEYSFPTRIERSVGTGGAWRISFHSTIDTNAQA